MLIDRKIRTATSGKQTGIPAETVMYDNYYSRMIKLIPAEVIAFYLALDGIASAMPQKDLLMWAALAISLIGGWFYLDRLANVTAVSQRLLTLFALVIWVYVLGGPFTSLHWYDVNYGKFVLVLFTFFVPVFYKGGTRDKGQGTSKTMT